MRISTAPRRKNAGRPAEKSAPGFLQWLRGRNCICQQFGGCGGKLEAAHVDHGGDKGMGTKASDKFAIPLCTWHHAEQHRIGWKSFQTKYRFVALEVAAFLWSRWPGRPNWEAKQ